MTRPTAKELNKACIRAASECPQYDPPEKDQKELVRGSLVNVAKLHKAGRDAVRAYWTNDRTIGGSVLWMSGYCKRLDASTLRELQR
ncbi:hypothetical protein [Herbaspirillum huttiense]|uniref:Uncharacterized protein n=1 Tax=Herbaspirillum huttiense subsp. lycopersici TaxID=3074428 RepID=A0ABU2EFY1_9BURK|nr:hypothetical protein [Herbaspirillum huttiense]MDR9847054.1 hypothetical protein [Herbaspirillum huttiense SE1]